jgi:hypothetical protein
MRGYFEKLKKNPEDPGINKIIGTSDAPGSV